MNIKQLGKTDPENWPVDARETIIATLKNTSAPASERLIAANLTMYESVMDDDMAKVLLSILKNRSENKEMRKKSAQMLGMAIADMSEPDDCDCPDCLGDIACSGNPEISERTLTEVQETMHLLYSDCDTNKEIRREALEASTAMPEDWHVEAVRMAYSCGDAEWVLTAVSCMSDLEGFEPEILESIDSADPKIRVAAVAAAGFRELPSAWPRIKSIIEQRPADLELYLTAIEVAPLTGGMDSVETLEALLHDEDPEIAYAADEALLELEGEPDDDDFGEDDPDVEDFGDEDDDDDDEEPDDGDE